MAKKLSMLLLVFSSFCFVQHLPANDISIVPKPFDMKVQEGQFTLTAKTAIVAENNAKETADFLAEMLEPATGYKLKVTSKAGAIFKPGKIILKINNRYMDELGKEGYRLGVDKKNILIEAAAPNGLFYGCQTLRQLLPVQIESKEIIDAVEWTVAAVEIKDKPRYKWRGMHLDVSRHFFDKEFVKRYIDLIAMHKMNVFHWHLTDDNGWRLEIKRYPKLAEKSAWRVDREDQPWRGRTPPKPGEKATYGGYYTHEDVKEIVTYAGRRHITVVPEIEMPGHTSEVFAAYPELSCRGKQLYVQPGLYWPNVDVFCAGNEQTFEFLQRVIDEVVELFPGPYIHIGGDEAKKTNWEACPKCQARIKAEGLKDEHELQSYFIKRMEKYINSKGKRLIGWDEILEGGLAPSATVMSWRGMKGGIEAAKMGHDVVMTPTDYCYFDYYQGDKKVEPVAIGGYIPLKKVYQFDPRPESLPLDKHKYILGGQANLWTEFVSTDEHAEYMVLPRMSALSEAVWSPKEHRNWEDFTLRMKKLYPRFDWMKVNYRKGDE